MLTLSPRVCVTKSGTDAAGDLLSWPQSAQYLPASAAWQFSQRCTAQYRLRMSRTPALSVMRVKKLSYSVSGMEPMSGPPSALMIIGTVLL